MITDKPQLVFRFRWIVAMGVFVCLAFGSMMHRLQKAHAADSPKLAAWMPAGALMTVESPDFAKLLQQWESSPEQHAWLVSENYAAFSRSRLFGRLQQAQAEFAGAAGLPVDKDFLDGVAGQQSFFGWYDIGKLQVVYITRMTPELQKRSELLNRAGRFEQRESGGVTFYVHSGTAEAQDETPGSSASDASGTANDTAGQTEVAATGETRTVAFATKGNWLVLATDEQLMARTLELMASETVSDDSLATQSWYANALAQAPAQAGELRMAIDMERVVRSPYFRTYWIQQNMTELSRYQAALCDLYEDTSGLHEDRVLLPKASDEATTTSPDQNADLTSLTALVPPGSAVYRAVAHPDAETVLATLNEKLLRRSVSGSPDSSMAPNENFATPQAGSATDLETRIDESDTSAGGQSSNQSLQALLKSLQVNAMLSVDTHVTDAQDNSAWVPFHAGVVLELATPPDLKTLEAALTGAIHPGLTAGSLGTSWTPEAGGLLITSDANPLVLSVSGKRVLIANDPSLLRAMLSGHTQSYDPQPTQAFLMSGFDARAAQPFFRRWTGMVDGIDKLSPASQENPAGGGDPPFFGKNISSLTAALPSHLTERFLARKDGELVRQEVLYSF